jgi:hypothetical protein
MAVRRIRTPPEGGIIMVTCGPHHMGINSETP